MNERLQELAEQAGLEFDDDLTLEPEPIYYATQTDVHKFAELIVRKCVSIVALHGITNFENEDISWACKNIVKEVKEHFGVE